MREFFQDEASVCSQSDNCDGCEMEVCEECVCGMCTILRLYLCRCGERRFERRLMDFGMCRQERNQGGWLDGY